MPEHMNEKLVTLLAANNYKNMSIYLKGKDAPIRGNAEVTPDFLIVKFSEENIYIPWSEIQAVGLATKKK
jgi:sporulation protein YlmC with PRC-barrel domain